MLLVVGGAGYIGSHTVKHLIEQNQECVIVDNLVSGNQAAVENLYNSALINNPKSQAPHFEKVDLADCLALAKIFKKHQISAVIHFAAYAYVGESVTNPRKYYLNNVVGTLNLLNAMLDAGVNKIVFSSSCATYGNPQYTPLDEKHLQNPINPYGQTKLIIEKMLTDYRVAYGLKYIALRYFNAAGADKNAQIGESHNPETHLIPLVLEAILQRTAADKKPKSVVKIFGTDYDTPDGTCIRDYIAVDDLALAHYLALEQLDNFSGCLNLGTGIGTSVKRVIAVAEEVTGQACPVEYAPRRVGDPPILLASNKMAQEVLGWTPKTIDIRDIIRTAWNWQLNRKF
ncbi:MAG: UDP-glucose 4-epimerase GalE [Deltaproteobacteria bacterium]|jgi:UDP-glucose 4-epimerase|nr:UDP-glucose 4-epimerase GalE [Deltaproteobacteria bacterium]